MTDALVEASDTVGENAEGAEPASPAQDERLETRPVREALPVPELRAFTSSHRTVIRGSDVEFAVIAGDTLLHDDDDEPVATIFSYSYFRTDTALDQRPVVFITSGGPGAASGALQAGLLGPWVSPGHRLDPSGPTMPASTAPYPYVTNDHSLLDVADLVFIDPVGTGYSRAVGRGRGSDFWGIDEDAESVAAFIHRWVEAHGRWDSPKFFAGGSYGGTRATLVADALAGGPWYQGFLRGVALDGLIVLVNGLGLPIGFAGVGNNALAATRLPSYAATAWYHERIDRRGRSLEDYFDEVYEFAVGDYLSALDADAGGTLDTTTRSAVVERLVDCTGLPTTVFDAGLVIPEPVFVSTVLGEGGRATGLYDGRFTIGRFGTDMAVDDAALSRSMPVLNGTWANIARQELGIDLPQSYAAVAWRTVLAGWNFDRRPQIMGPVDTTGTSAMHAAGLLNRNEHLHLFLGSGRFDLIVPGALGRYAVAQAGLPSDRVTVKEYDGGHDMLDDGCRPALLDDLHGFISRAAAC